MKHDLETKLIFVQIFFLALFEEKLYKLLDHLNIRWISGRISGIRPYLISGWAIWYPAGSDIKKGPIIRLDIRPAGYPVHPYFESSVLAWIRIEQNMKT
jgi:hypothetical protein